MTLYEFAFATFVTVLKLTALEFLSGIETYSSQKKNQELPNQRRQNKRTNYQAALKLKIAHRI